MDHWTVLSPDGRVLAVEEGQRRSKRGKDYVRGRSGCVEPAHRPGGEFTPHFGRGPGKRGNRSPVILSTTMNAGRIKLSTIRHRPRSTRVEASNCQQSRWNNQLEGGGCNLKSLDLVS